MELKQYEYQMLREEITENMKTQNNLSTFSLTLTISILSFNLGNNIITPYLFIIPLLLLLPATIKTHQIREDIMTISAYLSVRHEHKESVNWERNLNRYRYRYAGKRRAVTVFLECSEYTITGVICVVLYYTAICSDTTSISVAQHIILVVSATVVTYISYLSFDYMNMDYNKIERYRRRWEQIIDKD